MELIVDWQCKRLTPRVPTVGWFPAVSIELINFYKLASPTRQMKATISQLAKHCCFGKNMDTSTMFSSFLTPWIIINYQILFKKHYSTSNKTNIYSLCLSRNTYYYLKRHIFCTFYMRGINIVFHKAYARGTSRRRGWIKLIVSSATNTLPTSKDDKY